jgi:hypothetical protein
MLRWIETAAAAQSLFNMSPGARREPEYSAKYRPLKIVTKKVQKTALAFRH